MTQPADLYSSARPLPIRQRQAAQWQPEAWDFDDEMDFPDDDPSIWQPAPLAPKRNYLRMTIIGLLLLAGAGIGGLMLTETQKAEPSHSANAAAVTKPVAETAAPKAAAPTQTSVSTDGGIAILPSDNPTILKLQKAAAKGDFKAQLTLAEHYRAGKIVPEDFKLAQALLNNAAAAGYPPAMFELGQSHQEGRFAEPDLRAAIRWYEAAAATGHAQAAYNLGAIYETGADDVPDLAQALGWYQRAAGFGSDAAMAGIARLTPKRTPLTENDVKTLQQTLNDMGYDAGPANGKMGTKTADAIKAYQTEIGVMEDGRASRFLLDRLVADSKAEGDR